MATDLTVGDAETATLVVQPADGTTTATLTVHPVDADGTAGTPYAVDVSGGPVVDDTQTWTSDEPIVYGQPGKWVLAWEVTGTGEGSEPQEVYVLPSPTSGGPTWLPGRSRVANYVPHRTLVRPSGAVVQSAEAHAFTFDSSTVPTGAMVDRLIADGAAWLGSATGTVPAARTDAAATAVAIWVAAAVERGWPNDDSSLARARDLQALAESMRSDLVAAITGDNEEDPWAVSVSPVWCFEDPPPWAGSYL